MAGGIGAGEGAGSISADCLGANFPGAGADRAGTFTGAAARAAIFHDSFGGIHAGHRVSAGPIARATRHAPLEAISTLVRHRKIPGGFDRSSVEDCLTQQRHIIAANQFWRVYLTG